MNNALNHGTNHLVFRFKKTFLKFCCSFSFGRFVVLWLFLYNVYDRVKRGVLEPSLPTLAVAMQVATM